MKNILVVGLGNPGEKYEGTRHNLGIDVVRAWVTEHSEAGVPTSPWKEKADMHAQIASVSLPEAKVTCLFPLTFMNDSGQAVAAFTRWSGISVERIIIAHDDLETPFGIVQTQVGGSAHGHNGLRSIFDHLGTEDITRLRVGIGRPPEHKEVSSFVLESFSKEERQHIESSIVPMATRELTQLVGDRLVD